MAPSRSAICTHSHTYFNIHAFTHINIRMQYWMLVRMCQCLISIGHSTSKLQILTYDFALSSSSFDLCSCYCVYFIILLPQFCLTHSNTNAFLCLNCLQSCFCQKYVYMMICLVPCFFKAFINMKSELPETKWYRMQIFLQNSKSNVKNAVVLMRVRTKRRKRKHIVKKPPNW